MESYDLVIVGGGPAGCRAAEYAAAAGMRCVLIERQALGGVCLNSGCIPTKTLLHAANWFQRLREDGEKLGLGTFAGQLHAAALWRQKDRVIARLRAAQQKKLADAGVTLIMAEAQYAGCLDGAFRVLAGNQLLIGKHLLVATGSRSVLPDFSGVVTAEELLSTPEIPSRLLIAGGGMIGMEFAAIYSALGCLVTVVERGGQLGGAIPDFQAVELLKHEYERRGVTFILNAEFQESTGGQIVLSTGETLPPSPILWTCGRISDPQSFEAAPPACRIGDVAGRYLLAHAAEYEAECAVDRILGKFRDEAVWMPQVLYTDPEIAWIGSFSAGTRRLTVPLATSGKFAAENPLRNGFVSVALNAANELEGALIAGGPAGELIGYFSLLQQCKMGPEILQRVIFPHPSIAEIFLKKLQEVAEK